jgi:hypothetical protein
VNTIIRNWMPRQAAEAGKLFRDLLRSTASLRCATARLRRHHGLFAERVALCRRRVVHRLGALRVGRCVAFVDDAEYGEMMARKAALPKTRFGDGYEPEHVENIQRLTRQY